MAALPMAATPIGREQQVDALHRLVEELAAGRGSAAMVEGEPGIGKTSIARAAVSLARDTRVQVVWAVCDELSQAFPFLPLLEALRSHPDMPADEYARICDLLRADPGIGNRMDVIPAATEQLLALFDDVCAKAPTMLVVDDLQWADVATVMTLGRLLRGIDRTRLLIVALNRTVPRRDDLLALRRAIEPNVFRIESLQADQVTAFVSQLVGGTPGPGLLKLAAGAGGNPLYLTELVDVLVRAKALDHTEECVEAHDTATPRSLAAAISDRLEFISGPTHDVLRVAALLGIDFSVSELAVVSGHRLQDLLPVLDEAILAGVLLENGSEMAFRHPLIRQYLYDAMPAGVRAAWHRDAARALANNGASAERVARQLRPTVEEDAAGKVVDAWVVGWLSDSAPQLVGQAPQVAIPMLRWALNGTAPGNDVYDVLSCRLADALFRVGDPISATDVANTALMHVQRPDSLVDLHWTLMQCQALAGRSQESLDPLRRALNAPGIGPRQRARLLVLIARTYRTLGRVDAAGRVAEEALETATEAGDRFGMGWALFVRTIVHGMRGESEQALPLFDRALAVAEGDPALADLRLILQINQAVAFGVLNRYDDAIRLAERVRDGAQRAGAVFRLAQAHCVLGELLFDIGNWDDALVEIDLALDVSKDPMVDCFQHGLAATIQLHRGEADSERHLKAADRFAEKVGARICRPFAMARALQKEQADAPAAALEILLDGLSDRVQESEDTVNMLADAVRLATMLGDLSAAEAVVQRSVAMARDSVGPHRQAVAQHCQSLLANDPAGLIEAAKGYREAGRPLPRAQALEAAALILADRGDTSEARDLFTEAYGLYQKLGAEWDLSRTQATFRNFGIRRGPRVRHRQARRGWEALTPTEIKIAAMVAQGMSNPQIAAQLFLSRRTVQTHVSHILAKLELSSRIDIAREAGQREITHVVS
ncbi:Tetratricopeptide repeat-containing protein [Asanoa hainanensis]|uniref:Tetratricopeptide repeat-containing protein n=2 Tax=Asanoa hainanensis TaxID=560556 RepID=A0A239M8T9_9ACTN|nr:Tetratricopeptide repeat-containing protein [Asanoa hainanensis]